MVGIAELWEATTGLLSMTAEIEPWSLYDTRVLSLRLDRRIMSTFHCPSFVERSFLIGKRLVSSENARYLPRMHV